MQSGISTTTTTNSLPRLPATALIPTEGCSGSNSGGTALTSVPKAHGLYHFLPQHSGVKSARYRPPGFARSSNAVGAVGGPKRALSAPGLQVSASQISCTGKRDNSRSRRQQAISLTPGEHFFLLYSTECLESFSLIVIVVLYFLKLDLCCRTCCFFFLFIN